jgi:hypothetical protein
VNGLLSGLNVVGTIFGCAFFAGTSSSCSLRKGRCMLRICIKSIKKNIAEDLKK